LSRPLKYLSNAQNPTLKAAGRLVSLIAEGELRLPGGGAALDLENILRA